MSFAASRRLSSSKGVFLAVAALAASTACDPFRPAIREHILEGAQYAHYSRSPVRFSLPATADPNLVLGHLMFRVAGNNPSVLVVAACAYSDDSKEKETCSTEAFQVDVARGYSVSQAPPRAWTQGTPIPGSDSLRDAYGHPRSYDLPRITVDSRNAESETIGWKFRGNSYNRRNEWITALTFLESGDGRLVLLAGADKRKLPSRGVFFGDAVADGTYGNVTLDIFEGGPDRRVASVDLDCGMASADCMGYITVVSSRWVAIALDRDLSRAILFDFGEQGSPDTK